MNAAKISPPLIHTPTQQHKHQEKIIFTEYSEYVN
jgi:hypothetical protein